VEPAEDVVRPDLRLEAVLDRDDPLRGIASRAERLGREELARLQDQLVDGDRAAVDERFESRRPARGWRRG